VTPPRFGFPKSARLLRRSEFLAVKAAGPGFAEGPLAASYRFRPGPARVGLTVSTRVGNSVVRSRVKRILREAVRHERAGLPEVDLVLVARSSATKASVPELRAWIRRAIARIRRGQP
jgi:ribonuclease P protein component